MDLDIKSKYSSIARNGNVDEILTYLHELYENMPIPSVIINQDFIIEDISRQFLGVFDYERNEAIGKNILTYIDLEHHDIFLNSINKLDTFDSISGVEFQMVKKNGNKIDISFSAKIGNRYSENTLNIFCIMEDITFRKSCEFNLESKNKEMSLLLDNIETHVWYLKNSDTYGFVNKAHADFLGYTLDYLTNRNLNEFLPKEIAEGCIRGNNEVYSSKKTIHTEEWAPNYKGESRLLEITKTPLLDSEGNVKHVVCIGVDVTDKRMIENKLKENQDRLQSLFEGSMDAIWASTKEGRIVEANEAAANMLGCDLREFIGSKITDFYVNPKDRESFQKEVEEKKTVKNYEIKLKRKDGREIDCVFSSSLWANSKGESLGYIGIVHDITDFKKTSKELQNSKHLLENMIDFLPDPTFSIDKQGKIISWNKKIEELTGIKSEDMVGKGEHEYSVPFYGEKRPVLIDLILNPSELIDSKYDYIKKYGDSVEGETIIQNSNGDKINVWAKATALYDNSGKLIGAIETIRDITESKIKENELKKIYTAIDQGPGIIVITDIHGDIEYVNPRFIEITGYSSEDVLGQNLRLLKSSFLPPEFYTSLWDTISSGSTWKGEFHNRKKNGDFYWESATISPIRNKKGEIINYIKVSEDITMKKKVKKQIDENIEYFAHLIDHIRNPLAIMSGFIQLKIIDEEMRERLLRQIDRIEDIIVLLDKGWMDTEDTKKFLKKYS